MSRILILLVSLVLAACVTNSGGLPTPEGTEASHWALVHMELDESCLDNAGVLPLFPPPSGESFGMFPRAAGVFHTAPGGRAACTIRVSEPFIGIDGRPAWNTYDLVTYYGQLSPDGTQVWRPDMPELETALGVPTILHLSRDPSNRLRIQAATGDRLLPYVYIFSEGVREEPIVIPFLPR